MSSLEFPVTVVFHFDWGVSTGVGVAGGADSVVEKDERSFPVVRGTTLAGVLREQAVLAAQALDEGVSGRWHNLCEALFGSAERQRLVVFSDARVPDDERPPVHEVVSLSIDERTGTARKDFLRVFERVGACALEGKATLLDTGPGGGSLTWGKEQVDSARLLLSLAGLMVKGIGSNRSDGDGDCDVLIGESTTKDPGSRLQEVRSWCKGQVKRLTGNDGAVGASAGQPLFPDEEDSTPERTPHLAVRRAAASAKHQWCTTTLTISLTTPVVSYEVPMSNEVRSLDFLRGTVVLPWVHRLLRRELPRDEGVRDAVVNGKLLVSDALPVLPAGTGEQACGGLPVPLALATPKKADTDGGPLEVVNRLRSGEPQGQTYVPLRSGYVFVAEGAYDHPEIAGELGAPALQGRQSTAHDPSTGTAKQSQLFLVRALPAGLRLQSQVVLSADLAQRVGTKLKDRSFDAHMGSRRLSGTYGQVRCEFSPLSRVSPQEVEAGEATIWFTSDVLARSPRLGPGGGLTDLLDSFKRAGAPIELAAVDSEHFSLGLRHRRVDSWSASSHQPRPTRMAVKAGSVMRVKATQDPEITAARLAQLAVTGVGELTAQGFGRFVVNHPLLLKSEFKLSRLSPGELVGEHAVSREQEGQL